MTTTDHLGAAVMAAMADPVVVVGPNVALVWANEAAERRFGWSVEEMQGQSMVTLVHPDDHETAIQAMASVITKDVGSLVEVRLRDIRDEYSWFEIRGRAWPDGPVPGCVILNLRPTTERRRWELASGDSHLLATVLDCAPVALVALRADRTISGANRALNNRLHLPIEDILNRPLVDLVDPTDRSTVARVLDAVAGTNGSAQVEARLMVEGAPPIPMSLAIVDLLADRAVRGFVVSATDITSLVEARSALHHLANHDDLTGLPNRTNLRARLEHLLEGAPRSACTLLFGDVDGLKPVNDRYGHRAGDAALSEIAARLRSVTREEDYVARLSGDEFVMLISSTDQGVIDDVRSRIDKVMVEPIDLPDGPSVTMTISTGVAPMTESDISPDELLAAADEAMYAAKRQRTGGC